MFKHIDVHNHIKTKIPVESIYNTYCEEDIEKIDLVTNIHKSIGIHPKYVNFDIDFEKIESILGNESVNIGEVGLDRSGDNRELQITVLQEFLKLGNKYNKSITFHCVKSWGVMLDLVKNNLNRDLPHLFHGFSGSSEIMNSMLKGNSFFSFSLRELGRDRIINVIKSIPTGKLLIESDMSQNQYVQIGNNEYINSIDLTYNKLAEIKNIPIEEFQSIIDNNFNLFLRS